MAACNCTLKSLFLTSFPLSSHPNFQKPQTLFSISCCNNFIKSPPNNNEEARFQNLPKLSVTLNVTSPSLPQRKNRPVEKTEALSPKEFQKWTEGIPVVSNRLAYSEVLDLKRENRLNHIIKLLNVGLGQRPEVVLAVLGDNKVVRIVLPSVQADPKFWEEWDELEIDRVCMNAYSPPLRRVEFPKPYLGFLSKIPLWMFSLVKKKAQKPQSKKAMEFQRAREELSRRKNEEMAKILEELWPVECEVKECEKESHSKILS